MPVSLHFESAIAFIFTTLSFDHMNEFELIDKLTAQMRARLPDGVVGVGDDCAVLPQGDGGSMLVTTDLMVEDVHFRRAYFSAEDLGWKLVAVNLSDVAAMGGVPEYAVINLQISSGVEQSYLKALYCGIDQAASLYGVQIVGGDTSSSATFALGLTLIGRGKTPILRSGAKVGDDLWLSGRIGEAGLGLQILEGKLEVENSELEKQAKVAHLRPKPELFLAQALSEQNLANSMIDVSDGLIQDASHIASKSSCSILFDLEKIPTCTFKEKWTKPDALTSGEDYKILFSANPANRDKIFALKSRFPDLTLVGSIGEQSSEAKVVIDTGTKRLCAEEFLGSHSLGFLHKLR